MGDGFEDGAEVDGVGAEGGYRVEALLELAEAGEGGRGQVVP